MKRLIILCFVSFGLTLGISSCEYAQGDREIETDPQAIPKGGGIFTGRSGNGRLSDASNLPFTY